MHWKSSVKRASLVCYCSLDEGRAYLSVISSQTRRQCSYAETETL